jgi:hypothetical protein
MLPVIEEIRTSGYSTPQRIANALNGGGITAPRGGTWSAAQVRRVTVRLARKAQREAT